MLESKEEEEEEERQQQQERGARKVVMIRGEGKPQAPSVNSKGQGLGDLLHDLDEAEYNARGVPKGGRLALRPWAASSMCLSAGEEQIGEKARSRQASGTRTAGQIRVRVCECESVCLCACVRVGVPVSLHLCACMRVCVCDVVRTSFSEHA